MFRPFFVSLVLLLSPLPAAIAQPRLAPLAVSQAADRGCTPDKLCAAIVPEQAACEGQDCVAEAVGEKQLRVSGGPGERPEAAFPLADLRGADGQSEPQLWPMIIRFEGGLLAGLETQEIAGYSGGGATATTLHLIAFLDGKAPFVALSVKTQGDVMIRACFSERDMKFRAGACHDLYGFAAHLAPTGEMAAGLPVLRYRSKATSFPGRVSRSRDSLAGRPLRKRDLVTVTDPLCSYQRVYRFKPALGAYVANAPEPACSDYTVP